MKKVTIDGSRIERMSDVHTLLAEELDFPTWYGRNLDALHDCLTDITDETVIEITNRDALKEALTPRYGKLLNVLRDSAEENPKLTIEISD